MPVDINGYNLSEHGGLVLGASGCKIAAANYGIIDPMLPGMLGFCTDGSATYKVHPFPVNDVNLNIGSPWNVGTFRFTAPVAGIYYTSYSGIVGNGTVTSAQGYNAVCVNGALWYHSYKDTIANWELQHIEMMVNLAAGDYVTWAMNIAPAPDSGTNAGGYRSNHNTCTIWLVG